MAYQFEQSYRGHNIQIIETIRPGDGFVGRFFIRKPDAAFDAPPLFEECTFPKRFFNTPAIAAASVLMLQAYIRIKLLTGMARSDLLRLEPDIHFQEDSIHVTRHKTASSSGKSTIYEWNEDLRAAVAVALEVRTAAKSRWLFCTREGARYINEEKETASGWDSMWQRFMARVMTETTLAERFTEHDLRAKCASDAESLEHARALLSHVDSRIAQRVYRRKPERVQPWKIKV